MYTHEIHKEENVSDERTLKADIKQSWKGNRQKMRALTEIRWHGRGGQGAKTAALLLADVAFNTGKHVQGFPEYGPERMGAPITAYDRISDNPIRVHSNIYEPDFVVVVDDTLLHSVDVTNGLKEDGAILINTVKELDEVKPLLNGYKGKVFLIDARKVIVDGAVGMVEMALERLNENGVVELDEERKAAMVSNLLVVLCGNRDAQPIVNSGSLY